MKTLGRQERPNDRKEQRKGIPAKSIALSIVATTLLMALALTYIIFNLPPGTAHALFKIEPMRRFALIDAVSFGIEIFLIGFIYKIVVIFQAFLELQKPWLFLLGCSCSGVLRQTFHAIMNFTEGFEASYAAHAVSDAFGVLSLLFLGLAIYHFKGTFVR